MVDMTKDAVFLPGKIHGCEDEIYIVYENPDANVGRGAFEICVCNYELLLKACEKAGDNADRFFDLMPSYFVGKWKFCDAPSDEYDSYVEVFEDADFIVGRDGDEKDEFDFIVRWAQKRKKEVSANFEENIAEDKANKKKFFCYDAYGEEMFGRMKHICGVIKTQSKQRAEEWVKELCDDDITIKSVYVWEIAFDDDDFDEEHIRVCDYIEE